MACLRSNRTAVLHQAACCAVLCCVALTVSVAWVLWVAPALDCWLLHDEAVGGGAVQEEHVGHQLRVCARRGRGKTGREHVSTQ